MEIDINTILWLIVFLTICAWGWVIVEICRYDKKHKNEIVVK